MEPPWPSEGVEMSSKDSRENLTDTSEGSAPSRGRLPGEVRSQILEMSAEGLSPEEIAHRVGRSLAAVRKVLSVEESLLDGPAVLDLDKVIDFLSDLPEEAVQEVMQLAQLQRERSQLRSSLEMRLRGLKKPG